MTNKIQDFLDYITKKLAGVQATCYMMPHMNAYRISVSYNKQIVDMVISEYVIQNKDMKIVMDNFNEALTKLGYSRKKEIFKQEVDKIINE